VNTQPIAQPREHSTNCATTWTLKQLRNHVDTQPAKPFKRQKRCAIYIRY